MLRPNLQFLRMHIRLIRSFQFPMFYVLCNETTSHLDDHFASPSWKEMLLSFHSMGKGLRALMSACRLANHLLFDLTVSHHVWYFPFNAEIYESK